MNSLLTSNRFVAVLAYGTLLYVLVEYLREQRSTRRAWIAEFRASPRAAFARMQRERMIREEQEDCGCPSVSD